MLEIVKILAECLKCCPQPTPIYIKTQTDEFDSFDTSYATQNTTIQRQISREMPSMDSVGTTLQPLRQPLSGKCNLLIIFVSKILFQLHPHPYKRTGEKQDGRPILKQDRTGENGRVTIFGVF